MDVNEARKISKDFMGNPPRFVRLTAKQQSYVRGWGLQMLRNLEVDLPSSFILDVMCDFAGTESPLYALQELGVKYVHKASSDISAGCQKFIFRNHKPETFFTDAVARKAKDVEGIRPGGSIR